MPCHLILTPYGGNIVTKAKYMYKTPPIEYSTEKLCDDFGVIMVWCDTVYGQETNKRTSRLSSSELLDRGKGGENVTGTVFDVGSTFRKQRGQTSQVMIR